MRANPGEYVLPQWMSVPSYVADLTPPKPQLFDVVADPGEKLDLAAQYPAKASKLEATLADWYDEMEMERSSLFE